MFRQFADELKIRSSGRGFYEVTDEVLAFVHRANLQTGLLTVFVQHTSASLVIQENADPEVRRDFERFFAWLVPDGDAIFRHTSEGDDDMPAHIRSALTATTLSIPVVNGKPTLGTWQGIYVWEHRTEPHTRRVAIHLIGE
jgi:secondary thiamine-phosphate synthase enzyme